MLVTVMGYRIKAAVKAKDALKRLKSEISTNCNQRLQKQGQSSAAHQVLFKLLTMLFVKKLHFLNISTWEDS